MLGLGTKIRKKLELFGVIQDRRGSAKSWGYTIVVAFIILLVYPIIDGVLSPLFGAYALIGVPLTTAVSVAIPMHFLRKYIK